MNLCAGSSVTGKRNRVILNADNRDFTTTISGRSLTQINSTARIVVEWQTRSSVRPTGRVRKHSSARIFSGRRQGSDSIGTSRQMTTLSQTRGVTIVNLYALSTMAGTMNPISWQRSPCSARGVMNGPAFATRELLSRLTI